MLELKQLLGRILFKINNNFFTINFFFLTNSHAGYYYCGKTSAISYNYLKPAKNLTVFLLGPSHHAYFEGASLSSLKIYETPLGNINLNTESSQIFFFLIFIYMNFFEK